MKKIFLFIALLILDVSYAQKELWGYKLSNYESNDFQIPPEYNPGQIIKIPNLGTNQIPEIIHNFDPTGILGYNPRGRLFQASNGKLYGVAGRCSLSTNNDSNIPNGFLFEYDLVLNQYRIIANSNNISYLKNPNAGLIETSIGILVGTSADGNTIFKYNLNTDTVTLVSTIQEFTDGFLIKKPLFLGELMKASDGNLYGVTDIAPSSANVAFPGGIYKVNLSSNTITKVYTFGTDPNATDVIYPIKGPLVELSTGKLYGTSYGGADFVFPTNIGSGTLFEFDIYTGGMQKKFNFNRLINGQYPSTLIKASNNKLYGVLYCVNYSSNPTELNPDGVIYEYDVSTNILSMLNIMNWQVDGIGQLLSIATKSSDGYFYGTSLDGVFRFDPNTNDVAKKTEFSGVGLVQDLIEICRKPSYQEILVNTYTPEVGSTFTYNINNTNATTYFWKKGTTILPLQTSGILTLTNVTTNDTGVYTCTMTNECGTTITANLTINVINLGTDTIDNYKEQITLFPNPTKGNINLKFPENRGLKGIKYKITNLLGQTIQEQEITKIDSKDELTIDTAGFAKGVYQLRLITDKGDWNGKFVKE